VADQGLKGLARIIKAATYSRLGVRAAWRNEAAFREEICLCLVLFPLGLYLGETGVEKALLVATVILLPLVELLNSALEAVVDRIGKEHHELSGRAKDMGSAAVVFAMILLVSVWVLVLFVD
jgi:diacylglycerol kinase (ATP)